MHAANRILVLVILCLGLTACFTSEEPLIGAQDAVFPFERIVFEEVSNPGDRQTWTRKGDAYSFRPGDSEEREARMRLKAVGENLYVAQMEFPEGENVERLYALLRADPSAKRVDSFAAVMPDGFQARPGLSICDKAACIDDLDAYVAYARAQIESGAHPDAEYRIIEME